MDKATGVQFDVETAQHLNQLMVRNCIERSGDVEGDNVHREPREQRPMHTAHQVNQKMLSAAVSPVGVLVWVGERLNFRKDPAIDYAFLDLHDGVD